MKKIIIPVVIIAAIFVGAPYLTGKIAETETKKMIDGFNQSASTYGTTEVLSYERGLRSTQARYKYLPPAQFAGFAKEFGEIIYACDSSHGVTGIDFSCNLEGESAYSKFVTEELGGKDPLSIYGSISAFGGISQTIALEEVKNFELDGATVTIPNAKITVDTDAKGSAIKLSGGSDAFDMQGNGQTMNVGAMSLSGDMEKVGEGLFVGDFVMDLESFVAGGPLGETSIDGMSVRTETAENGDNLSSNAVISIKQIVSAVMPFESVKDINMAMDIDGLDKQAFIEYQQIAQQMQADAMLAIEGNQEPPMPQAQMAQLTPVIEKMLKQGLDLSSKVSAKLNGENNDIALKLKLLESLSFSQLPQFMTAPDEALKKVNIKLDASLAKQVVDGQPMAAAFITRSPLVSANADDYALNLALGQEISLNGKEMSFAELQALVFSSLPF